MENCENCFTHNIDDNKKIVYRGMVFCDIDCFINSKHFDASEIQELKDAKQEYEELQNEFKAISDEKADLEALNKTFIDGLQGLLVLNDDKFQKGNEDFDNLLIALTTLKDESEPA